MNFVNNHLLSNGTNKYIHMLEAAITVPTKVTRAALENAASVSGMLLTTECVITEVKKDEPAMQ